MGLGTAQTTETKSPGEGGEREVQKARKQGLWRRDLETALKLFMVLTGITYIHTTLSKQCLNSIRCNTCGSPVIRDAPHTA